MKTLELYGNDGIERVNAAKEAIENGAKYNGVVYGRRANKNNINISIYVDGKETYIKRVENADAEKVKAEIAAYLSVAPKAISKEVAAPKTSSVKGQTEWCVNGRTVKNNLTYGEMYDRYGMDFE